MRRKTRSRLFTHPEAGRTAWASATYERRVWPKTPVARALVRTTAKRSCRPPATGETVASATAASNATGIS